MVTRRLAVAKGQRVAKTTFGGRVGRAYAAVKRACSALLAAGLAGASAGAVRRLLRA